MTNQKSTKEEIIERLRVQIAGNRQDASQALIKFQEGIAEDATYTLEWGDRALTAAGEVRVATITSMYLDRYEAGQMTAEEAREAMEQAWTEGLEGAFQSSTSQMSNLTKRAQAEVWNKRYGKGHSGHFGYRRGFELLP